MKFDPLALVGAGLVFAAAAQANSLQARYLTIKDEDTSHWPKRSNKDPEIVKETTYKGIEIHSCHKDDLPVIHRGIDELIRIANQGHHVAGSAKPGDDNGYAHYFGEEASVQKVVHKGFGLFTTPHSLQFHFKCNYEPKRSDHTSYAEADALPAHKLKTHLPEVTLNPRIIFGKHAGGNPLPLKKDEEDEIWKKYCEGKKTVDFSTFGSSLLHELTHLDKFGIDAGLPDKIPTTSEEEEESEENCEPGEEMDVEKRDDELEKRANTPGHKVSKTRGGRAGHGKTASGKKHRVCKPRKTHGKPNEHGKQNEHEKHKEPAKHNEHAAHPKEVKHHDKPKRALISRLFGRDVVTSLLARTSDHEGDNKRKHSPSGSESGDHKKTKTEGEEEGEEEMHGTEDFSSGEDFAHARLLNLEKTRKNPLLNAPSWEGMGIEVMAEIICGHREIHA